MVRLVILGLLLTSCAITSKDVPNLGQEVDAPYGWKYTYCPEHNTDVGCSSLENRND